MFFEIDGKISNIETFATGRAIRELPRLNKIYGKGNWRKRKGDAMARFSNGETRFVELRWYEATGIGKKKYKIKKFFD